MKKTHEIVIIHAKDKTDEIIVYQGQLSDVMLMFGWYDAHRRFFNGEVMVREIQEV